ncbi:hypothetical protein F66182_12616 [Fusarium sp. NRRL 66182]|nr:hypothetical protein F66182_12616 [Fusarium sp. NRRL 66182]
MNSQRPPQNPALPFGFLVLVTGSNGHIGYIGSHIVKSLLEFEYLVRGTVREPKPWLDEVFPGKYGVSKCESEVVPQIDKVKPEHIFAFAETYTLANFLAIIRKIRPAGWEQLISPPGNEDQDINKILPRERAEELLHNFYGKG